jgi:hypothetical protein
MCSRAIRVWVGAYRVLLRRSTKLDLTKIRRCRKVRSIFEASARGVGDTFRRRASCDPIAPPHPTGCLSPTNMTATGLIMKEAKAKHLKHLVGIFILWKTVLLGLAAFCPGPGYDTSALMLIDPSINRHTNFSSLSRFDRLTLNLFRWDALYTVKAAERGKLHEQEWAFSWAYSRLLGAVGHRKWTKLMFWGYH